MGEKVMNRDLFFPICVKRLPVFSDGVIEHHFPGFDELHERCRRRNDLGEGCNVENGIRGHHTLLGFNARRPNAQRLENLFRFQSG